MFRLRLVPDDTKIPFMRGRYAGLIVSALLSLASIVLFFHPGLNYGIDFRGGIVIEARTPQAADFASLRHTLNQLDMGQVQLQEFGSPQDVLIRLERQPGDDAAQQVAADKVRSTLATAIPGTTVRRVEAVGASISGELFFNGMLALGLAMVAMLVYIWFRFEWQFGAGAVATLVLDVTKIVGFYAITGMQFNLTAVAAILTIMGYSVNDKVVVYDRMRENLRIYKKMPLRELIDRSINETLNRTLGTSMCTLLSILPLAFFGGEALQDFGIVLIFGIFLATSSSIFIAAPILLFLGENRLRRNAPADGAAPAANPTP
ncbi:MULTISPECIES: protein translocase subunit SecF [Azospirillum]|uniref:Protein-export membrane protein SecF n=1 Tax=Azospirillum brasilense TaxID=192 RepID=A0A235HH83_AZOBR|nr:MULTISPECIES: protein translocase subunit SecF [Azospirillum]OYD85032.1 protein translocase subunit SecF [Azospirillum brasilense]